MSSELNDITDYPSGWRSARLADCVKINPESLGSGTPESYEFRYIDISSVEKGIVDWEEVETHTYETAPSRAKRIVRSGDVLLSTVRPTLQGHTYADWGRSGEFVCSTGFAVLRAGPEVEPSYLRHLVFSDIVDRQLRERITGSNYPAVRSSDVEELEIPLPEISEQRRIAGVLETVDAAIQETDRVVEKQEQVKTGLLQDLLTRGLDADGRLRDPERKPEAFRETELGDRPMEWEIRPVGELLTGITQGWSPKCHPDPAPQGQWGILRTTSVQWEGFKEEENKALPSDLSPRPEYEVEPMDILMTRAGPASRVGVVAMVKDVRDKLLLSDKLYRLEHSSDILPGFLYAALSSEELQGLLGREKTGMAGSQTNISQRIVKELPLPYPPLAEQERIVSVLEGHANRIASENGYSEKLQCLKTGLMQDLLTGRVRVPEVEARVDEVVV